MYLLINLSEVQYLHARDYTYKCEIDGEFEWFQGYEYILYNDRKIYECHFHGGIIV